MPPQHQREQPGLESKTIQEPEYIREDYQGANKLKGKVVLITSGDSGINLNVKSF